MAGFVPSPNTVTVKLHWALHGRPQLNVLHAQYTPAGPLNPNCAQNIFAAAIGSATWTTYQAVLGTFCTLTAIGVTDIRSDGNPEILSTGTASSGLATATPLADATSLVLTERTAMTGKAHRGRIYTLGWTSSSILTDGTAQPSHGDAAVAWYTAVMNAMATQSMILAIRSTAKPDRPSKPGGTLPSKPYEITPVTVIQKRDNIFDTNRRRTDQLHR